MVEPRALFIFHSQDAMEMMTKRSMRKSSTMAQKSPLLLTATGTKPLKDEYRSHGMGRLLRERDSKVHGARRMKKVGDKEIHYLHVHQHFVFNSNTQRYWSSPHGDVENVTAHRAGYSHVPQAFTRHNHTSNEVRDGCPCSQNSQAHNLF